MREQDAAVTNQSADNDLEHPSTRAWTSDNERPLRAAAGARAVPQPLAVSEDQTMPVEVVPYSPDWPLQFEQVAEDLRAALVHVRSAVVEHVGSTSVPGLSAKPILDIDVVVDGEEICGAVAALESIDYVHRGDLGVSDREAFQAPDAAPRRHVYVGVRGALSVRNHVAVRDVLRSCPDLREEYAAVKLALAADPSMEIDAYIARKSAVLQKVLAVSDLTSEERLTILRLNDPSA